MWLTRDRTSPYAFYQYWVNVADADVVQFLKWFTFLERDEIDAIAEQHEAAPHRRVGQLALAECMTRLIHGEDDLARIPCLSADCDLDTVPDECQIAANPGLDTNGNGILDICEPVTVTVDSGQTVIINAAGSTGAPTDDTPVEFTNVSQTDGATVTVTQVGENQQPGAGDFAVFDTQLIV